MWEAAGWSVAPVLKEEEEEERKEAGIGGAGSIGKKEARVKKRVKRRRKRGVRRREEEALPADNQLISRFVFSFCLSSSFKRGSWDPAPLFFSIATHFLCRPSVNLRQLTNARPPAQEKEEGEAMRRRRRRRGWCRRGKAADVSCQIEIHLRRRRHRRPYLS